MSVVFWAFATWLIPVLVAAGVWRHFVRKVPLVYVPTLWSMIFPLGMYAVAGIYLGRRPASDRRGDRVQLAVGGGHCVGHRLRRHGPQRQPSARHPPSLEGGQRGASPAAIRPSSGARDVVQPGTARSNERPEISSTSMATTTDFGLAPTVESGAAR